MSLLEASYSCIKSIGGPDSSCQGRRTASKQNIRLVAVVEASRDTDIVVRVDRVDAFLQCACEVGMYGNILSEEESCQLRAQDRNKETY